MVVKAKNISVPNTNNDHSSKTGNIYAMFFGVWNARWAIVKVGQSVHPAQRAVEHYRNGNQFVQGREPKILMNLTVRKNSQDRLENLNRNNWDRAKGLYRAKGCNDTFFLDTFQETVIKLEDADGTIYKMEIPVMWKEKTDDYEMPPIATFALSLVEEMKISLASKE